MVNGQVSTTKVFQHHPNIDICCGNLNSDKLRKHMRNIGTKIQRRTSWRNTSTDIMMSQSWMFLKNFDVMQSTAVQIQDYLSKNMSRSISSPRMQLNVTRKTSRTYMKPSMTILVAMDAFLTVWFFQMLAMRYLGAGLLDSDYVNKDYPYRSSKSFSCMFFNLGNWQRSRFASNPLPERLEKYRTHISFDFDLNTSWLVTGHFTTTSSWMWWRISYHIFSWLVKQPHSTNAGPESKKVAIWYALMTTRIWW